MGGEVRGNYRRRRRGIKGKYGKLEESIGGVARGPEGK